MYTAPVISVCLIPCLCLSLHILHFNRIHNPTNGLWHAINKESNNNRVFTVLANYGSIPGFVDNSGTPQEWHSQCVFLERSVWWERMWCCRRLWEERGGELGLGAAGTENRIGPHTDLVRWGIKELAALLPTIDTTHPVKHIPPPDRITDKSPCLRHSCLMKFQTSSTPLLGKRSLCV